MKITIRRALPEDAFEYTLCHAASWRAAYKGIVPDEYLNNLLMKERAKRLKRYLYNEPDGHESYCAVYEDKMIGILSVGRCLDEDEPEAGEIESIYLIEEFWDKGCGRQMINFAIDRLKSIGYNKMILWVLEKNNRARQFYERCGFVFDGTKKEREIGKPLVVIRYILDCKHSGANC